jgi:SPP1 gp7 family putative phage head morphogenesis protein
MTENLSAYNAWKRTTLDRLTAKYRRMFTHIYAEHLHKQQARMVEALENGQHTIAIHADELKPLMHKVYIAHQAAVVKAAVSDGMREVTPENKLGAWQEYPYWYPVEESFHNTIELKLRDSIFDVIHKKLKKKYTYTQIIDLDLERYKRNVTNIFRKAAESFFKEPDTTDTKEVVKDVLGRVFKLTDNAAERTFRTETTRYFNEARVGYFQNNTKVDFVQVVAITDGRISDLCEHRNGYVIPVSESGKPRFKPPYHYNCRTVLSPLITYIKSHAKRVEDNLGAEFQVVHSDTTNKDFKGKRTLPSQFNFNHSLPS